MLDGLEQVFEDACTIHPLEDVNTMPLRFHFFDKEGYSFQCFLDKQALS